MQLQRKFIAKLQGVVQIFLQKNAAAIIHYPTHTTPRTRPETYLKTYPAPRLIYIYKLFRLFRLFGINGINGIIYLLTLFN